MPAVFRTRLFTKLFATRRRGVVSVLAMMLLVLFGSLGLAMAITSRGNLRTAATQIHVNRALSAAETGLAVAKARLEEAVGRFVVARGTLSTAYAESLWDGTAPRGARVLEVLPPPSGFSETGLPPGIVQALSNHHSADQNIVAFSGALIAPAIGSATAGADEDVFRLDSWLYTPAVGIDGSASAPGAAPAAYQITYAPLANGTDIRVIVTGFSSIGASGSSYAYSVGEENVTRPLTRTIQQDFRFAKRHTHAVMSSTRLLFAKNVAVNGTVGTRYTTTNVEDGDPFLVKSDFFGLNTQLNQRLTAFYNGVRQFDVNGDNRLRTGHQVERQGVPNGSTFASGPGDNPFGDATRDRYVDDFDIFINFYDTSPADGRLVLSNALKAGTPNELSTAEFVTSGGAPIDEDLALQLDSAVPDRNGNGISGFVDTNGNGRWDSGETLNDPDDQVLGWRDGVIDYKDQYAKVRGRLMMRVARSQWDADRGGYQQYVQGAIVPPAGQSATRFGATNNEMPNISDVSIYSEGQAALASLATGSFSEQVASNRGISVSSLATHIEDRTDATQPRFWRANLDNAYVKSRTGRDLWEKMPFNSPNFFDWYIRPRYENMVFRNVTIPRGTNALFINCVFLGVTRVQTTAANTHENWSLYGRLQWDGTVSRPVPVPGALDRSDFLRYTTGSIADGPANYNDFPDPPVVDGVVRTGAARDTKLYSNNIRFHNCTVVGSIVSDVPAVFTQMRNKLQFTGSTRYTDSYPGWSPSEAVQTESAKSSLMVPNYSVDLGTFNSPTDTYSGPSPPLAQDIRLKGTIIAGVLDARGNTTIDGAILMTFAPQAGVAPMVQRGAAIGNPANFNASFGYLGPDDGDGESLDPSTLPLDTDPVHTTPVRIVGWDMDGDGLPDRPATPRPSAAEITAGARLVPFYGFGRVTINYNPDIPMPDGIMLPLRVAAIPGTYQEGKR